MQGSIRWKTAICPRRKAQHPSQLYYHRSNSWREAAMQKKNDLGEDSARSTVSSSLPNSSKYRESAKCLCASRPLRNGGSRLYRNRSWHENSGRSADSTLTIWVQRLCTLVHAQHDQDLIILQREHRCSFYSASSFPHQRTPQNLGHEGRISTLSRPNSHETSDQIVIK